MKVNYNYLRAFSHYSLMESIKREKGTHYHSRRTFLTMSQFLGYIPVVNLIVGIGRMTLSSNDKFKSEFRGNEKFYTAMKVRGALECFVGPLLAVSDLIGSIAYGIVVLSDKDKK